MAELAFSPEADQVLTHPVGHDVVGFEIDDARVKRLAAGESYKRNTGDARESPAMVVADRLLSLGAEVRAADPHVVEGHRRVTRVELTPDELADADAVVILTDHDAFDYEAVARHARYVLDTRHRLHAGVKVEFL